MNVTRTICYTRDAIAAALATPGRAQGKPAAIDTGTGEFRRPAMSSRRRASRGSPALRLAAAVAILASGGAHAVEQIGQASGLPLPRYVSLKSDRVNLREGPSKDHRTKWVFQRAGLPVEIVAEFETWRRVRDSEGTEGWVLHSLLSGRRTALVAPWRKGTDLLLYAKPSTSAATVAKLQPNVIAHVKSCDRTWCRIFGPGFDGYIPQPDLWGVYPDETIE